MTPASPPNRDRPEQPSLPEGATPPGNLTLPQDPALPTPLEPETSAPETSATVEEKDEAKQEAEQPRTGVDPLKLAGIAALAGVGLTALFRHTPLFQPQPMFRPGFANSDAVVQPVAQPAFLTQRSGASQNEAVQAETAPDAANPVQWPSFKRLSGEGSGIQAGSASSVLTPLPLAGARSSASAELTAAAPVMSSNPARASEPRAARSAEPARSASASAPQQPSFVASASPARSAAAPSVNRSTPRPEATHPETASPSDVVSTASSPPVTAFRPSRDNQLDAVTQPPAPLRPESPLAPTIAPATRPAIAPSLPNNRRLKFLVGVAAAPRATVPAIRRGGSCSSDGSTSTEWQINPFVPAVLAQADSAQVESTMSDSLTVFLQVTPPESLSQAAPPPQLQLAVQADDNPEEDLYLNTVRLPLQAGVFAIRVPAAQVALQLDRTYLWQASVLCDVDDPSKGQTASGWVKRVASKTAPDALREKAAFYAEQGVWPDALLAVLQHQRQAPSQAKQDLQDLMESAQVPRQWANGQFAWLQ